MTAVCLHLQYSEEDKNKTDEEKNVDGLVRGIGTDVGIVSCMVFLAQFILSLSMGSIIRHVTMIQLSAVCLHFEIMTSVYLLF